jgi:hypothetical protein
MILGLHRFQSFYYQQFDQQKLPNFSYHQYVIFWPETKHCICKLIVNPLMGYSWEDRCLSGPEIWTESRLAAHAWKYHLCKHDDEFWNTQLPPPCWINNPAAFPWSSVHPSVHDCRSLMYLKLWSIATAISIMIVWFFFRLRRLSDM